MKKLISRILCLVMLVSCFCGASAMAEEKVAAAVVSCNPLIDPQEVEIAKTPQRYTNILLLGIDLSAPGYKASGYWAKKELGDCHTDSIMVASINMTTDEVNLISIPRDTLTYVPGVHGIYKLNAAFNCSDSVEEGLERIRSAVSWHLGGIQIDHYCAVDMATMIKLGDHIGGVDLDVEMSYTGQSGIRYKKGMQHLDGQGIMDYIRARTNATVNANDHGRTNRNRQTMTAIFHKLKSNASLVKSSWDYATSGELNFYTDLSLAKVLNLLNKVKNADNIGSYVLEGQYRSALDDWNFTFTNQENRKEVIKTVYGIEVEEIPYVSYTYTKWLMDEGFTSVRNIACARELLATAKQSETMTDEQKTAVATLEAAIDEAVLAFDDAADAMGENNTQSKMINERREMRDAANKVSLLFTGAEFDTYSGKLWFVDPMINEYPDIVWQ